MGLIKNFNALATTEPRKKILSLVESALVAIQPENILKSKVILRGEQLHIKDQKYDLSQFEHIYLVGFGKGSSGIVKYLENLLGEKLTEGWDIDLVDETFTKVHYTKGTHPVPSQINIDFTNTVVNALSELEENDLVLVVICGGGSAMFESLAIPLVQLEKLSQDMLRSGATIEEMNIIRKHVSQVKGGGFAKILAPSHVVSLIFSDVPGNDLSTIASGPTTIDSHTKEEAIRILQKYHIQDISTEELIDLPKSAEFFQNVHNILVVSNQTALSAMEEKAKELGLKPRILTDQLQGNARELGKKLLEETKSEEVLLAGGESTMKVIGHGKGGRNQALVLSSLPFIKGDTILVAFDSDGMDYFGYAGAMGDAQTVKKAEKLGLSQKEYVDNDDSYHFFEKVGDGIDTGKLESNVSDLYIVWKK